jgi:protein-disulfide isomerase
VKSHPFGVAAATAAMAAERQGKFWPMHDLLFANRASLSEEKIEKLAAGLGLDMARFARDRADPSVLDRIRAEKMEGLSLGVTATPGIFINGKPYLSAKTYEGLKDRIEEELEILAESAKPR